MQYFFFLVHFVHEVEIYSTTTMDPFVNRLRSSNLANLFHWSSVQHTNGNRNHKAYIPDFTEVTEVTGFRCGYGNKMVISIAPLCMNVIQVEGNIIKEIWRDK